MSKSIAKPTAQASSRTRANARRVAKLPRQADLLDPVKPVAATRAARKAEAPVKTAQAQSAKAQANVAAQAPAKVQAKRVPAKVSATRVPASKTPQAALPHNAAALTEQLSLQAAPAMATKSTVAALSTPTAAATTAIAPSAPTAPVTPMPAHTAPSPSSSRTAGQPSGKAQPVAKPAKPQAAAPSPAVVAASPASTPTAAVPPASVPPAESGLAESGPPEASAGSLQSRRRSLSQATKALVLQGGGALGAYQAGAIEVMHAQYQELDWVAGVSIGAINGALIAGNPPERRVAALREFWRTVSSAPGQLMPRWGGDERLLAEASAGCAVTFGIPGMFTPMPSPLWLFGLNAPLTGVYNTDPMRETLLRLVDFDLLNRGDVRFSVGAVNVRTGNSTYFDNHSQTIGPEHIMASAALPPGFPAVHIDGEDYWDGGVVSNTPLQHVLDHQARDKALVVMQIDLFSAQGQLPTTIGEVIARQKDIQYSSRTRMNSSNLEAQINLAEKLAALLRRLPPEMQQYAEVQVLRQHLQRKPVDIVHLIYRSQRPFAAADFEFSRTAVDMHWQAGARDMTHTLRHPELLRAAHEHGVTTYDLSDEANPRVRHRLDAELV